MAAEAFLHQMHTGPKIPATFLVYRTLSRLIIDVPGDPQHGNDWC